MKRDYGQPAVHNDHSERTFGEDKEIVFQSSGNRSHSKGGGAVSRIRTRLCRGSKTVPYGAQRTRHSARAAVRFSLK